MPKPESPLRPPKQDRSKIRLDRIVSVTEKLLKERRFDQITITDIVKEAETSVGVFYSRFPNKQALLEFLQEKVYEEAQAMVATEMAKSPPQDTADGVRQLVSLSLQLHRQFSGISREIVHQAWGDPAQLKRGVKWNQEIVNVLRPILASFVDKKVHSDPNKAAEMAILILLGSIREMVPGNFWPKRMRPSVKDIEGELSRNVYSYLTGKPLKD